LKPEPEPSLAGQRYWQAACEGRLALQRCDRCGHAIHYPREWCPSCWSTDLSWFHASGRAELVSFTIVHQAQSAAFAADAPYVLAVVRLEEGPQMMANVLGVDPRTVEIGMKLRVIFERRGALVLPQFTRAL
jgi:uncharacterized OB-fold protein